MDPRNLSAQDEIAFASGKRVKVFVAEEVRILEALERYYGEECPSRFGLVLDRLNRARFLWDKPAVVPSEPAGELLPSVDNPFAPRDSPLAPPPKIFLPPALPELEPPSAAPSRAPAPGGRAGVQRRDRRRAAGQRLRAAEPAASPGAAARRAADPADADADLPDAPDRDHAAGPPHHPGAGAGRGRRGCRRCREIAAAAAAAPAAAPAGPPPRSQSVSLTPEERADLGAVAWIETAAADRSLPMPASLDEAEAELAKATDLEEVARLLLGFLGRDHRRVGHLPGHPRPGQRLAGARHGDRPRGLRRLLDRLRPALDLPQPAPRQRPLPRPAAADARPPPARPHLGGRPAARLRDAAGAHQGPPADR